MSKKAWFTALTICLAVVSLSPLASSAPDGLEKVAEDKGFAGLALQAPFEVVANYVFPGIENEALATVLAGWLGTILVFGLAYGLARLVRAGRSATKTRPDA